MQDCYIYHMLSLKACSKMFSACKIINLIDYSDENDIPDTNDVLQNNQEKK